MATVQIPAEQRFVLHAVDWPTYVGFSDQLGERHVRVTYNRGVMEFMTLSPEHERDKHLLNLFIIFIAQEMDINIAGYGSMTSRREDLDRGLEPDECYWVANEPVVRGRTDLDPAQDPPPDLVIEVEVSRSALNRMGIYASLGVPEVWRWDGQTLRVCLLDPNGNYAEGERSRAFPFLPAVELVRFLYQAGTTSETQLLRSFRAWVREQAARDWQPVADGPAAP
jgi:Uma2 family endonuclease